MPNDLIKHYDLLIDEENDPVNDPPELQAYMNGWDGPAFLAALELNGTQDVLEIGVGTGRLAVQVAPLAKHFTGIDVSPKTVQRAREHLGNGVTLVCGDFMVHPFEQQFDVIYASLTLMHIKEKEVALRKIAGLLKPGGRVVLSLDKDQSGVIQYGEREIKVYPDTPESLMAISCGLHWQKAVEVPFAHIVTAIKPE